MNRYYDTRAAARIMGTDTGSVREMCRNGNLKGAVKDQKSGQWLIPEAALEAWLGDKTAGQASGGDTYHITQVDNSVIAAGREARVSIQTGRSEQDIRRAFETVHQKVQALPAEKEPDKSLIADTVKDIETEVIKKDDADQSNLARWFRLLAVMAPDILEVTLDTILNPLKGISTVVRKIAERAQTENPPAES